MSKPVSVLLPITGRRGGRNGVVIAHAVVRNDAFARTDLLGRRWSITKHGYAHRVTKSGGRQRTVFLHRVVFERYFGALPAGEQIDHKDRDKLNNTPGNLRSVTRGVNAANTPVRPDNHSGLKGVRLHNSGRPKPWQARVQVNGKPMSLGYFATSRAAADAVNRAYATHYPGTPTPNP
jgi:hypothetical protein